MYYQLEGGMELELLIVKLDLHSQIDSNQDRKKFQDLDTMNKKHNLECTEMLNITRHFQALNLLLIDKAIINFIQIIFISNPKFCIITNIKIHETVN